MINPATNEPPLLIDPFPDKEMDDTVTFHEIKRWSGKSYQSIKRCRDKGELYAVKSCGEWVTTKRVYLQYLNRIPLQKDVGQQMSESSASSGRNPSNKAEQIQAREDGFRELRSLGIPAKQRS